MKRIIRYGDWFVEHELGKLRRFSKKTLIRLTREQNTRKLANPRIKPPSPPHSITYETTGFFPRNVDGRVWTIHGFE